MHPSLQTQGWRRALAAVVVGLVLFLPVNAVAAYRDSTTASGSSRTPTCTAPTGVQVDDILIIAASMDAQEATVDPGDWPAGFTELRESPDTFTEGQTTAIGWKRATGTDAYTFTTWGSTSPTPNWMCQAWAYSGRHTTDAPESSTNAVVTAGAVSGATITPNTVTALLGDDLLMISAPDVSGSLLGNRHTFTGTYTEDEDQENDFVNLAGATLANSAAGTSAASATFATSGGGTFGHISWTIRMPAAAGGGPAAAPKLMLLGVG